MLVDHVLHEITRTEYSPRASPTYTTLQPQTRSFITQEDVAIQTMRNHGILNTYICLIEDKNEKIRGVDVESTTWKTKCRRY
jgi:hypothetical protein